MVQIVIINDDGELEVIQGKLPKECKWMKKVIKDRQHLGKRTYNVLRKQKGDEQHESQNGLGRNDEYD